MPPSSRLFRAVVLMGYALAGCRIESVSDSAQDAGAARAHRGDAGSRTKDDASSSETAQADSGGAGGQGSGSHDPGDAEAALDAGGFDAIVRALDGGRDAMVDALDGAVADASVIVTVDASTHDAAVPVADAGHDAGWPPTK